MHAPRPGSLHAGWQGSTSSADRGPDRPATPASGRRTCTPTGELVEQATRDEKRELLMQLVSNSSCEAGRLTVE